MKYHGLGTSNKRHLFRAVLEAGKSKLKVPAGLFPGEGSVRGLQMAVFLLCPHTVLSLLSLLIRAPIPSWGSILLTWSPPKVLTSKCHCFDD